MQADDLAKAIAVMRSFEDEEREQILPVVLEDWLEVKLWTAKRQLQIEGCCSPFFEAMLLCLKKLLAIWGICLQYFRVTAGNFV